MIPYFQLSFALAFLLAYAESSNADSGLSTPLEGTKGPALRGNEERHLPLLTRFELIAGELTDHAQDLSLNEAMKLRNSALKIVKAMEMHHEVASPPPRPPQPSECGVIPDPYPSKSNLPLGHRQKIASHYNLPLSYFEAGYYGNVSSRDPRVFGPDCWRTLHRFSIGYPKSPTPETKKGCENFLAGLPYMVPCPHCGYHLREFTVLNAQYSGESRNECLGTCTSIEKICETQAILVGFLARAHNNVNIHNYKFRPNWTTSDVYRTFAHGSVQMGPYGPGPTPWTTQGPVDGKCELITAMGQNETGSPDFWKSGAKEDILKNLKICSEDDATVSAMVV